MYSSLHVKFTEILISCAWAFKIFVIDRSKLSVCKNHIVDYVNYSAGISGKYIHTAIS